MNDSGVNVTLIVQNRPAPSVVPQLLLSAKSSALGPLMAIRLMVSGSAPLFDRVIAWGALVVPKFWLPNVRPMGDKLTGELWLKLILVINTSPPPAFVAWRGLTVGKSVEPV